MAEIREDMSKQDIIINMLEIANHLSKQEGDVNQIDVKVKNLNMQFKAWRDEKQREENR